jgi:AcrR family transcriptional regulator
VANALLEAAERIVDEDGLDALSVRVVANAVGVTTRAVYSLFGSKDGLLVALGTRAFHLLEGALDALPTTSDPAGDLVEAGVVVFRRFVLGHPALLRIGFQFESMSPELTCQFRDAADAARMLRELSGRTHEVVTGLAVVYALSGGDAPSGREETLAVTTRVTMIDAGAEEIAAYVATGEPLDKAGAYAVQGIGARLVARVEGCFTNVVGLPVETTRRLLERWGFF